MRHHVNTVILTSSCDSWRTWAHSRVMTSVVSPSLQSIRLLVNSWIKLSEVSRLTSHEATSLALTHALNSIRTSVSEFSPEKQPQQRERSIFCSSVSLNLFSGQLFLTMHLHSSFHMTSVSWDCCTTFLPGVVIWINVQVWKWQTGVLPGELLQRGKQRCCCQITAVTGIQSEIYFHGNTNCYNDFPLDNKTSSNTSCVKE